MDEQKRPLQRFVQGDFAPATLRELSKVKGERYVDQPTKPSWKTGEFWLQMVALVLSCVLASGALDGLAPSHWAVKVVGVATMILGALGYSVSRTIHKSTVARVAGSVEVAKLEAKKDPSAGG